MEKLSVDSKINVTEVAIPADIRSKTVVDPDIIFVELDGPRGRGLGYYKKSQATVETAVNHPKIQKVIDKSLKK